ncbi:MAG: hypothetical protein HDQ97_13895 [Lachnospiraceae bacterium]|nr:hypothetical protein [Lachnospiraceae bacterium]
MKIKGFLCGTTATTNEEYRKELKRRNIWMMVLILAGILISGTAIYAEQLQKTALSEEILAVYTGFGVGIAVAGIILLIKSMILMGNEEKLKLDRLENADERLKEIRGKAVHVTLVVMLLVIVVGGMIYSMFEPVMIKAMIFLLDVIAFSYIVAFSYYKRKM